MKLVSSKSFFMFFLLSDIKLFGLMHAFHKAVTVLSFGNILCIYVHHLFVQLWHILSSLI
ncbi:hypothetical protein GCM10010978_06350 [Compostibacillus humi]|uniref:Uncharacterized protein n=1 Tax=Compostibacillus humi TaxID=1245525 RepID=A0A8J2ZQ06_9BACI|nr:hypothetical protein GCM10010978_06350 [Compostibacillus humi]